MSCHDTPAAAVMVNEQGECVRLGNISTGHWSTIHNGIAATYTGGGTRFLVHMRAVKLRSRLR